MQRDIKKIEISDFDYPLPQERIALHPSAQRDGCKLLVSDANAKVEHKLFSDLPQLLPAPSLLVCNNTRVINARMRFQKSTGAEIEIFCLEPESPRDYALMFQSRKNCRWISLVGNLKRWKEPELTKSLTIDGKEIILTAERVCKHDERSWVIEFSWEGDFTFATVLEHAGYIPIPPYLKRESEKADADDYQTIYSRVEGSVAAPTAGLHFTPELMRKLRDTGVEVAEVTLQVGAGTFQPVKAAHIGEHPMHTEVFGIDRNLIVKLIEARQKKLPIIAVGTTTVRTLESLPLLGMHLLNGCNKPDVTQWEAYELADSPDTDSALLAILEYMDKNGLESMTSSTSIMIAPGFDWRIVEKMITNFHQPQSTLLLLVSSFLDGGGDAWRKIYEQALDNDYRFLSYGDACLFSRNSDM